MSNNNSLILTRNETAVSIAMQIEQIKISGSNINLHTQHLNCITDFDTPISALVVRNGEKTDITLCNEVIEVYLIELFEWFGRDISIQMIKSLAKTIYQNYYWLRLTELKLFFEKFKGGDFGKEFHKLNPAIVMSHMGEFANESLELREQIQLAKHENATAQEKQKVFDKSAMQINEAFAMAFMDKK